MKKFTPKVLSFLVLLFGFQVLQAQTVSFNTMTLGTGYTPNNGQNGITFVIENTNPFPAVLNSVSNYFGTFGSGLSDFTLWYSATSLSGAPGAITAPNWSPVASVTGVNCPAGVQTTVFPLLAFSIPGNTTYRFYLQSSITLDYCNSGATVTPNTFTNTGVSLIVGDATIAGLPVGYGGGIGSVTFNPRSFLGTVSLTLLSSPCAGQPTAGTATATPFNPCPGVPITLALTGVTAASGLAFQWQRATTPTGPWTTAGLVTATTNPSFYLPPAGSTTYYRCIVTCTFSGLNDTSNVTSPAVIVQPWSPTSPCYCGSTFSSTVDDDIGQFTLGTFVNPAVAPTPQAPNPLSVNTYTNFMSLTPVPSYTQGLNYPVNIYQINSSSFQYTCWAKVYIDFNHNASFSDPGEEVFSSISNATNGFSPSGTIYIPPTSLPGQTRLRAILNETSVGTWGPCVTGTWGETEDYIININPAGPYDPNISSMGAPVGNLCTDSTENLTAQICNYGSLPINTAVHPIYVSFVVNGPGGPVTYIDTLNVGVLSPFGVGCQTASVSPVNMFAGGTYSLNTYVSCPTLSNASLSNDSLSAPIVITNYRPTAGPDYQLCQFNAIPFGQGLTVGGCSAPLSDSITINFTVTGPCVDGNNDANSCQFATGILPALIPGASITGGYFSISNLATVGSSWTSEMRFNIYGTSPTGANIFSPGVASIGSATTASANFTYQRNVSALQLANMYTILTPGNPVNIGYWESFNDNPGSDITLNAGGGTTVVSLKIYYNYVPPAFAWYDVPTGGTSLYSLSPFNPLLFTNAVVNNSNVAGTYSFYAACLGLPTCRVPVNLVINPTPSACQDTLLKCEYAPGANNAVFDLTTMNLPVSCFNTLADVEYYYDQALITLVTTPTNDTNSTGVLYSKVFYASTGCYSSDTLYLDVSTIPQFSLPVYTGFACAPNSIDIGSIVSIFPPNQIDTSYFDDPLYTIPYTGNPQAITTADTVYLIVTTTNPAACADSSVAYIDVLPATNEIANQAVGNFSVCGPVPCGNLQMADGNTETLYTTNDCRRIATITDSLDLISLGTTTICEDIDCSIQNHNGQPYVARRYEITPTNNGRATVCLYYLEQDFQDYNATAFPAWPFMDPNFNLCITQIDGGALGVPGTTALSIPNSSITSSYDVATTVWTVCFPVDSFSTFICHTCNPGNAPLPVTLNSFTGKKQNETSLLEWETSSEVNNSHFVLERSKDGKQFSALSGKISSKSPNGNSSMPLTYAYTDAQPLDGMNYYRLQQVDLDGHISYSGTVSLYFGNESVISLYPNPVSQVLNIDINTPKSTTALLKIFDATGRVVRTVEMSLTAGNNSSSIDIQSLADGVYMIQISNNKGLNFTERIRKQ